MTLAPGLSMPLDAAVFRAIGMLEETVLPKLRRQT
jgi:hypothetical protein